MLIHLRKFSKKHLEGGGSPQSPILSEILFSDSPDLREGVESTVDSDDIHHPVDSIDTMEINMVTDEERPCVLAGHQHKLVS